MRPLIGVPCQGNLRSKYHRFCVAKSYCRALNAAGGAPVLLPLLDDSEAMLDVYERLDGLLLAGGGDIAPHHFGETRFTRLMGVDPPRDRAELLLARRAVEDGLPLLAICRGIQVLNVALGGTLYQDIATQIPQALRHDFHPEHARNYLGHGVWVKPETRLADILGEESREVNSFHHQSIKGVPMALQVTASAPDGVTEAVETQGQAFVVGVQWHPEELIEDDPRMRRLFEAFIDEARTARRHCRRPGVVPAASLLRSQGASAAES
jgi:putative glutamine amidotransferase